MSRTIVGLFDSYDEAARAVRRLEDAGVPYRNISMVANATGGRHIVPEGTTDDASKGAGTGVAVGAALGGSAGLLAGLGVIAIPGLGPMIAAGWLAATAAGAAAGGAAGGIIGALTGAGLSDEDAHVYAESLRRGGTLVTARVEDESYESARAILSEAPAVDISARARTYRESGWTRFEEAAPPYATTEERADMLASVTETPVRAPSSNPLIASDRVAGTTVYDPNGKPLGSVKSLMIDKTSGRVAYLVMAYGGLHGLGEMAHPIPWNALAYDENLQGYRSTITEEQIRSLPT